MEVARLSFHVMLLYLAAAGDLLLLQSGSVSSPRIPLVLQCEVPGPGHVYVGSYRQQTVCLWRQRGTPEDVRAIYRGSEVQPGLKHDNINC